MTSDTVKWLINSILEKAQETVKEYPSKKTEFAEGLMEGYYEVLDMLKSRLTAAGEDLSEYGLEIDLEALETELKRA